MHRIAVLAAGLLAIALPGCRGQAAPEGIPGDTGDSTPFAAIGENETVKFTGTEPFWGGEVAGSSLTYSTPENIDGTEVPVTRFAGRGGVSWSGMYDGARFVLAVTPGSCSDGLPGPDPMGG